MNNKLTRIVTRYRHRKDERKVLRPAGATNDAVHITNDTVAARREEVLGSARKYIYPLQASKHRIVKLSVGVSVIAIVSFFTFCMLELYKFQTTSSFMYGVTRVLPFPVAVVNNRYFVSYNDYLFQLRHYMHYYQTQQHVDFGTAAGKQQLAVFRQRSLNEVLQNAYVQRLASKNHLSVSDKEIDTAVALVRSQNRLGANDQVFRSVLNEFWGWTVDDFRRELGQELLAQKVVDRLDSSTHERANEALSELQQGADFATVAKNMSDDVSTKQAGGNYGVLIDKSSTDIAPQVVDALFQLQPGQYSGIINTGYSLEIVKVLSVQGTQVRAAHIAFNFQPVTAYTKPLEAKEKSRIFIHV
ncbi:MAG TPA: peptidylprolyl isomerase [Candidatus Saccharimonadales bacterium]|nr:peptidylprolyl isomerase [Candidatus Saccharimonadales bacterium]